MMTPISEAKEWYPAHCLFPDNTGGTPFAVLVLNLPIHNSDVFWLVAGRTNEARAIIAADGGANRLKDWLEDTGNWDDVVRSPKAVIGDFDSLLPETRTYFEKQGVPFLEDTDQYSTDFTKCLKFIKQYHRSWLKDDESQLDIAVFGGLGGRADQAFAQLHQLYTASQDDELRCGDIYLYTEESIIFLLEKGRNLIHTPVSQDELGENVGIIPLSTAATITTDGLEWDVKDWKTSFGTQVSTSNHIKKEWVTIDTTERVLFTVELARKPSMEQQFTRKRWLK